MAKDKTNQADLSRPYGQNKRPKNLRFTPETLRKLKQASLQEGVSETVYVELALKAQFKKDNIQ